MRVIRVDVRITEALIGAVCDAPGVETTHSLDDATGRPGIFQGGTYDIDVTRRAQAAVTVGNRPAADVEVAAAVDA